MELLVISNFDLMKFGCPYCGSLEGWVFIANGTCSIWSCCDCADDCLVVENDIEEIYQFTLRDTDIKDLIRNHPYQDDCGCQINSYTLRMNNIPIS